MTWGRCRVTAYCPCAECCGEYALNRPVDDAGKPIVYGASGSVLTSLESCASSLPFGTVVHIPELDMDFVVQDRAADFIDQKYGGMYIDIYIDDHNEALQFITGQPEYMEVLIRER